MTKPHEEGDEVENERDEHERRVHGAEPLRLPLEIDVVGVARQRGEEHEHDPDPDGGRRRGALAREIEDQRDDVRADRDVGDRGVERVAEPDAIEKILDYRNRLVERREYRDEELAERIGPDGLRLEDPLDHPMQHAASLVRSSG